MARLTNPSPELAILYEIEDALLAEIKGMMVYTEAAGHPGKPAGASPNVTGPVVVQHREHWDSRWDKLKLLREHIAEVEKVEVDSPYTFDVTSEMSAW